MYRLADTGKYLLGLFALLLSITPGTVHAQTTTIVNFDSPVPSGTPDSYLNGTFGGINFGTNQWRWSGPYSSDPTNNAYFANSTGTSRTFSFAAPRVLLSMNAYTVVNGTLTLSDGVNPTVTRTITTGSLQNVATGWTLASTTITVGFTGGWALGVDDITYADAGPADGTPPTVSVTAPTAGSTVSGIIGLTANASDNVAVAGVQFLIDNVATGSEDTIAPYNINWDTTTAGNGAHTITARARDLTGNTATSAGVSVTVSNSAGSGFGNSLRFYGAGVNDIDRVKIRIDDPATTLPGPPMDVGATDFTLEFWINGNSTDNASALVAGGVNNNWIYGNIIVDRDRFSQDRNFGISIAGGRVVFGVAGQGTGFQTIVGTTSVLDNQWHHVAIQRRRSDGWMWIYVDGQLQSQVDGPNGDISYPDDGVPGNFCNGPCTNSDPFMVLGAEKHDAGSQYPAFDGYFDELRVSTTLRYSSNFTRPNRPFSSDPNTAGLYHFDEGNGDYIYDSSGAFGGPSLGVRRFGGTPAGPEWATQTPFTVAPASQVGQWLSMYSWPLIAINSIMLRTGQVLVWDGETDLGLGGISARLWNPATGEFTAVPNNSTDLFCSSHSFLPDGRVLVAGGNVALYVGLRNANIFNPVNSTWTPVPDMSFARWYPTTVTLGDGRILVINGSTSCNDCVVLIPEIYNSATNAWTQLTGASLSMPTYPHMFLLPDGRAFVGSSNEEPMATYALNIATQTWTTIDPNLAQGGASVQYQPGRIMKAGSSSDVDQPSAPSITTTWAIDMNQPSPAWRVIEPMKFPRGHHTMTILPDGNVLVTGGGRTTDGTNTAQGVLEPELWSPTSESWTTMAPGTRPRLYHSTALLMPDGRVLSAGGGRFSGFPTIDQLNAEIFSPPYLFKGERPAITSIPTSVQHGATFQIGNAAPNNVARVTMLAPGAVTHEVNMSQRFAELTFTRTASGLDVQAPSNPNIAPPGYYLIFLIGTNGVPSIGSFVQVTPTTAPAPVPTVTNTSPTSATAGGAAFTLTVNGTGFTSSSVVRWNNNNRTTGFNSSTQLTASITAADIASQGTASVTVFTPAPGGGTSNAATFTINPSNPVPATTSLSPNTVAAGSGAFTLTVNGSNFVSGSTVRWNGGNRTTTFVSATQLTAAITAADVASASTVTVTVFSPAPGGGTSNAQTFTTTGTNPVPTTTSISPAGVTAGGAAFTLTVNGTNFVTGGVSTVRFNGSNRTTTFVSATQLTATLTAADRAIGGTGSVTVFNTTPGGGTSNAQTLSIGNPAPTTTGLSPTSVTAGGATFTLTVNGTNFISGASTVRWNGNDRATTFVSATQLTTQITAADIAAAGTGSVTVFTATPGGGTSGAQTLSINNPAPTTTGLSPSSVMAGSGAFTLTVNGTNFISGVSTVRWNGSNRTTTFVSATQLTAAITAADVASAGSGSVTVFNATPGGGTSNAQTLSITATNPVPATTSLSPTSVVAGSNAFTLTVNGSNFVNGAVVRWNNADRTTTFGSAAQLTAQITAADVASMGSATVTVFNPAPGGGTSNGQTFTITATNPVPATTSLSPTSISAGSAAFTLTVNGSNFVNGAIVRWNGADRTTTFGSAAQVTAQITAADVASATTATVTVFNPAPGGGTSNGQTFTITTGGGTPQGLVAAYSMNIGSGTAVADTSGNNNNGTVANGTWAAGQFGNALVFNGTSTLVSVPDTASLDLTTGVTMEAWVYPTVQPTGWRAIIVKEQPGNVLYYLHAGSSSANSPATGVFVGGAERSLVGGTRLAANTWVHLASTYDGANQRLYINGVQVSTRAQTGAISTSTSPLRIGGNSVFGEYFTGRIDEVRIYNRALTAAEIQTDMATPIP